MHSGAKVCSIVHRYIHAFYPPTCYEIKVINKKICMFIATQNKKL